MALRWRTRTNHVCFAHEGTTTSQKKSGLAYSSSTPQAVKNTCNGSVESKGFCHKCTNGIKRHLAIDTLELPFSRTALPASVSDDQGLIELLSNYLDYFRTKPVNLPKITILLDHGITRTNYPSPCNKSPDYDEDCTHCRAICLSWLLCILLAKWINSKSSSTLTISSAYRRILVLLALSRLLPPCPYQ